MFSRLHSWLNDTQTTDGAFSAAISCDHPDTQSTESCRKNDNRNTVLLEPNGSVAASPLPPQAKSIIASTSCSAEAAFSAATSGIMADCLSAISSEKDNRPKPSSLTRIAPRATKLEIDFQVVWQTLDLIGRLRVYTSSCISLSLPDLHSDLARMISKDELVTGPVDVAYVIISFPLKKPTKRLIRPARTKLGFRRDELCLSLAQTYQDVYEIERYSSNDPTSELWTKRNGPGDGSGKFGIYQYALHDLFLTSILWDPSKCEFRLRIEV